jgi:thymidine phosphorylase
MIAEINDRAVADYQIARLQQNAASKSINDEVGILLRIMADRGDVLRSNPFPPSRWL